MYNFPSNYVLQSLMIVYILANSADPDEMPRVASCGISSGSSLFTKIPLNGFPLYKGLIGR